MPRPFLVLSVVAVTLAMLSGPAAARGQTAWYEGFEGPEPTWHDAGGDAQYRIQQHRRLQGEAHTGAGCERLAIVGSQGTYVHVSHDVGRPRVIDELMPSVWIKSDRPGLQILASVVLPRTQDPRSGRPVSTLLRGSTYTSVGQWQQLRIDDIPRLLDRQVRILRSQMGPAVDGREAYVDRVLLNVYGGPGVTNVWIDDLDVAGFVGRPSGPDEPAPPPGSPDSLQADRPQRRRVELVGSVLSVDGRPFFPRMIRHRGEPLELFRQLGFNTVWLEGIASPEVLAEADRLDLWVVCPPPRPARLDPGAGAVSALADIGPEYDRVLAWDLGRGLSDEQLEPTRLWAEQVRLADRRQRRPLVCLPESDLRGFSRLVDLLLLERQPLGTSLELADYGEWVRGQPRLARPGTPIWTGVQTQPAEALCRQLAALGPGRPLPGSVSSEQIRLLAYTAVASGSRGLLFQSRTPLDAADPETRHRAMALELVNLELQLIEPWAAAGTVVAAAEGSQPEYAGNVLRANRSRLLIPVWSGPGAQLAAGQSAGNPVWFVVPGVPETNRAYQLIPGGLQPPRDQQRQTGGVRIALDEFGLTGAVLLAHDPLVVNSLASRSVQVGPRAAQLARDIAVRELHTTGQIAEQLPGQPPLAGQSAQWKAAALEILRQCDTHLAAKEYHSSYLYAQRAMRSLGAVQRAYWEAAVARLPSPLSSPATVGFATLPWQRSLIERVASSRSGPSRLPGGDCEQLPAMLDAGWRHFQYATPGLRTAADLVAEAAHSGSKGLRLGVRAEDPGNPPMVVETPPVWITTPALPVEAGDLVCIQGWVQIPAKITGSVDGLLIVDSLAGEPLAQRIGQTDGWQQFTLYRAAPESGLISVTFALSGLGEAWLDDVTIRCLEPARPERVTQLPPASREPR